MADRIKYSTTKYPYEVEVNGYTIVIPAGSRVCNQTAAGFDDNYRFVTGTAAIARAITGLPTSMLEHDLRHRGINVPAGYCHPYQPDRPAPGTPEPGSVFLISSPVRVSENYPHLATVAVRLGIDMHDASAVSAALAAARSVVVAGTHDDTLLAEEFCVSAALPKRAEVWIWCPINSKLQKA